MSIRRAALTTALGARPVCLVGLVAVPAFLEAGCGGGGGGGSTTPGGGGGAGLPDLRAELVAFDPATLVAGTQVSISDTIANRGAGSAANVRVGLYLSSDAAVTTADRLLGFRTVAALAPGQTSSGGGTLTIPASTAGGTYWIGAVADDVAAIAETSEANNVAVATTSIAVQPAVLPNLRPSAFSVLQSSALSGGPLDVSDTVVNAGVAAAGPFQVGVYLSSDATITSSDVLLGMRPVLGLAVGAQSSASDVLAIPGETATGSYWVGALADAGAAVSELDEDDNALATAAPIAITAPPRPNLVVQSFVVSPPTLDAGASIVLSDTVANVGPGVASTFDVGVYLSTDATITRTDVLLGTRSLAGLAPGATDSSSGPLAIPADTAGGSYWVGEIADVGLAVPETSEADNALAASAPIVVTVPPRPDLAPQAIAFTPAVVDTTVGATVHVSENVVNSGVASAGSFRVGVYLSSNPVITSADILIASCVVSSLGVGAGSAAIADVPIPSGTSPGTYYVGVVADDLLQQLELAEANNVLLAPGTLDVVASPLPMPDLLVHAVSYSPHQALTGGVIQVLDEVRNQGTLSSGPFQIGVYLSTDDVIATDDLRIGGRTVLQLGIQFGSASSAPYALPQNLAPGTYFVGAIADDGAQVSESLEANNALRASGTLVVTVPAPPMPDLTATAVGFTPSSAGPGQLVQLSATVKNQGTLAAGSFRVAFYASTDATVDASDVLLGTQDIGALAIDQTFVGTIGATLPAGFAPGDRWIAALVDDAHAVAESTETNNQLSAPQLLHVP